MAEKANPWPMVLARVGQTLERAIAEADQREQALVQDAQSPESTAALREALLALRERIGGLESCGHGAGGKIAAIETALAESEAELRTWLQAAAGARAKLADWAGSAVG